MNINKLMQTSYGERLPHEYDFGRANIACRPSNGEGLADEY